MADIAARDRLIDDLETLVRIESITGSEENVADLGGRSSAGARTARRGVRPDLDASAPTRVARRGDGADDAADRRRAGRTGRRSPLILSGHLDVVPPGDPATWSVDPWGAEVRDGRLYGRGACDMKGGVAAILAAVRALGAEGSLHRLGGELMVVLVPSEEDGGQGTLAAIRRGDRRHGDHHRALDLDVVVAHAGAITFRLTVPGRAAHASQRREGVSALDKLFELSGRSRRTSAAERGRDRSVDDRPWTAVPDDHRDRRRGEWASTVLDKVVADGRYGVRLGQSPADAEADLRPRSPRPVPRTTSCGTIRRRSRSPADASDRRASRPTTRCRPASPQSSSE